MYPATPPRTTVRSSSLSQSKSSAQKGLIFLRVTNVTHHCRFGPDLGEIYWLRAFLDVKIYTSHPIDLPAVHFSTKTPRLPLYSPRQNAGSCVCPAVE